MVGNNYITFFYSLASMASFPSKSIVARRLGDHYDILEPIGQPFGYQQLLASDTQNQRPVVIKSLAIEQNTPTGDICCFEREIHLLESLQHPTIPRCIESFSLDTAEGKGLVLVQSHQGGRALEAQIAAGKSFSEAEIKAIAKQLLQGLVYFHSKGLVHRDIKPSNIAVSTLDANSNQQNASSNHQLAHQQNSKQNRKRDRKSSLTIGQATWLNLGTVQYIQAQSTDAMVGTYGYMPPEQIGGKAKFASDLYSLGATLIYLAAGVHLGDLPRNGHQPQFTCDTSRLSADFQQWINWLIEPHVKNRPASAKQALRSLNHLPLAMLKRRIWKAKKAQMSPVPITTNGRNHYQPFFTQIRSKKKPHSLELTIPPIGIRSAAFKQALVPLAMGTIMLSAAVYLAHLLNFSSAFSAALLTSPNGLATLLAAALAVVGCTYSFRFLTSGLKQLQICLLRRVQIQIEADVLLVAYRYWLQAPKYIVNTKRDCIYNISALPDGSALRILTHHNRTEASCLCYKLTLSDGMLSRRDVRWLTSLLNDWRSYCDL